MFGLGVPEVAVLLLWAAGVACAVGGTLSKVFGVRDGILALAVAAFIPVLGSIGVIAWYLTCRSAAGPDAMS